MDMRDGINISTLARNTRLVAEALASHIFNVGGGLIFANQLVSAVEGIRDWVSSTLTSLTFCFRVLRKIPCVPGLTTCLCNHALPNYWR